MVSGFLLGGSVWADVLTLFYRFEWAMKFKVGVGCGLGLRQLRRYGTPSSGHAAANANRLIQLLLID